MAANKALELHKDYSELFDAFELLEPNDINDALEEWSHKYMSTSWEQFGRHLDRMQNYLDKSKLDKDRKDIICQSLSLQKGAYLTGLRWPEKRQYINEGDKRDLVDCRTCLLMEFSFAEEMYSLPFAKVMMLPVQERSALLRIKEINSRLEVLNVKLAEPAHILNSFIGNDKKRLLAFTEKAVLRAARKKKNAAKSTMIGSSLADKAGEVSLSELCIPSHPLKRGDTEYIRNQDVISKGIRLIWDDLPDNIKFSCSTKTYAEDARASAVAVFKLMQWIGKVEDVCPSKWIPILWHEWGIEISSGISKYTINEECPMHFKLAVKKALEITQSKFPLWLKNAKKLPKSYL